MSCIDGKCRAAELEARAENAEGRARVLDWSLRETRRLALGAGDALLEMRRTVGLPPDGGTSLQARVERLAEVERRVDAVLAQPGLPDWARSILLGVVQ